MVHRGVDKFIYDEQTRCFYYSRAQNREAIDFIFRGASPARQPFAIDLAPSRIVSINLSPSRVLMTTAMGNPYAGLTLTKLPDRDSVFGFLRSLSVGLPIADHPVSHASQKLVLSESTFWGSAAKPHPTSSEFVVAAGEKVLLVYPREGWSWEIKPEFPSPTRSDALAVDWLDTNVVLCGHRDGKVTLWDTRSSGIHARSSPIQHSACVSHVRRMNQSRIAVAGLEDQLSTYDLRFLPTNGRKHLAPSSVSKASRAKPRPKPKSTPQVQTTTPYLTFPSYLNKSQPGYTLGFDVSSTANLIASACDRPGTSPSILASENLISAGEAVQIFDASTGKVLRLGESGRGVEREIDSSEEDDEEGGGQQQPHENENGRGQALVPVAGSAWFDDDRRVTRGSGDLQTAGRSNREERTGRRRRRDFEQLGSLVTCLKFVEGGDRQGQGQGQSGLSLMVGSEAGVEEWSW